MNTQRTGGMKKQAVLYTGTKSFTMKCFGKPSRRMITEAVTIGEIDEEESMNNKREWTYVALDKI